MSLADAWAAARDVEGWLTEAQARRLFAAADGPVDLLFVDGAHRFGPAPADLVRWGERVPDGGRMLVHDAFSSVGVTPALLTATVGRPSWRYAGREGSPAAYVRSALIAGGWRDGPWPH